MLSRVTVPPRFEVKGELGRGGMAVVFHAFDKVGRRDVALKFLPPTDDEQMRKRFQREAVDLAAVFHPNVVDFYSLGESEGQEFIEMEYVGGGTLGSFLRKCDSLRTVLQVFAQVAEGLHHIHEAGLVHRDLKPANVLMTEDGIPKISDLGLARQQESRTQLTQDGTVLGTAAYLAPEQLRSHAVGPGADLYAFGVCLFEGVTSSRPFQASTPLALLRAHMEEIPPAPSEVLPGLPASLDKLILSLMEKKPENRPSTGAEVASTLKAISEGLTPAQDKLVASSPQALLARARLHFLAGDYDSAQHVLSNLPGDAEEDVILAARVEQAKLAVVTKNPDALEKAQDVVAVCREKDDLQLLGQALVALGQAATQRDDWELALASLQEARGLIPSNSQMAQLELLESLASLHDRGSATGYPGLEAERAAQFRKIASGLAKRADSSQSVNSNRQSEAGEAPPTRVMEPARPVKLPKWLLAMAVLLVIGLAVGGYRFLNRPAAVEIVSDPAGATIMINEERYQSPFKGRLEAGDYQVKVFLQGHFPKEETIQLAAGQNFKMTAALKPASGDLKLTSKPVGAKIYVNGQARGKTPAELTGLPIKKFKVKFVKEGYKPLEKEVEVFGGKTRNLEFALTKIPPPPPVYRSSGYSSGYSSGGSYSSGGGSSSSSSKGRGRRRGPSIDFSKGGVKVHIPKPKFRF